MKQEKWYRFAAPGALSQWGHATVAQAKAYTEARARRYPGATYTEVAGEPTDEGCTIVNVGVMLRSLHAHRASPDVKMTLSDVVKIMNDAGLEAELFLGTDGRLSVFGRIPENWHIETGRTIKRCSGDVCVNLERGRVSKYYTPERLRAGIAASTPWKRYQEILKDNERWLADYAAKKTEKAIRDWTWIDTSTEQLASA